MKRALVNAWILGAILCSSVMALAQDKLQDKGAGFSDAVITEAVTSALGSDPMLARMHISVETHEGVVHLRGQVDSMAQVERAAALARRVDGVSSVRNAIRVANRPSRA